MMTQRQRYDCFLTCDCCGEQDVNAFVSFDLTLMDYVSVCGDSASFFGVIIFMRTSVMIEKFRFFLKNFDEPGTHLTVKISYQLNLCMCYEMIGDECEDRNKPKDASSALKINRMFYLLISTWQKIPLFFPSASPLIIQWRMVCGGWGPAFFFFCSVMWVTVRKRRQWFERRVCSRLVPLWFNLPSFLCAPNVFLPRLTHTYSSLSLLHPPSLSTCGNTIKMSLNDRFLQPGSGTERPSRAAPLTQYELAVLFYAIKWKNGQHFDSFDSWMQLFSDDLYNYSYYHSLVCSNRIYRWLWAS